MSLRLEMKTSPRLVQQVGIVERFAGAWDRLSQSEVLASEQAFEASLKSGAEACLLLDTSTPPLTGSVFVDRKPGMSLIYSTTEAHLLASEFDLEGIAELFQTLVLGHIDQVEPIKFRSDNTSFCSPGLGDRANEMVFSTVPAFLVEPRITELLEWAQHELEERQFHPLFIIGTFHLVFLQISPFNTANHRVALVLLWRLLEAHGYSFIRYRHFAPSMLARAPQYFAALRQAEKTAYGTWSTLNVWLEFFLDLLVGCSQDLLQLTERTVSSAKLSGVQRTIVDLIKRHGSATREKIVTETGINLSTIKYNLSVLSSRGQLKRDGGGRATSYSLL